MDECSKCGGTFSCPVTLWEFQGRGVFNVPEFRKFLVKPKRGWTSFKARVCRNNHFERYLEALIVQYSESKSSTRCVNVNIDILERWQELMGKAGYVLTQNQMRNTLNGNPDASCKGMI